MLADSCTIDLRKQVFERAAADGANEESVPWCSELVLKERRSCMIEDEDTFIHVWGVVREANLTRIVNHLNCVCNRKSGRGQR